MAARQPLATAGAVLFAQLVDDPSERENEFRSEAAVAGSTDVDAHVARAWMPNVSVSSTWRRE